MNNYSKRIRGNDRSEAAWRHNALLGSAAFSQKAMQRVIDSPTATPRAKALAADIQQNCISLREALSERVDPC